MSANHPTVHHLRKVADAMDSAVAIPGTNYRVGADGIIGLIPGVGDVFGLVVSSYFILVSASLRIPKTVLARMFVNVAIDSAIGAIPFVGDVFDFVWKSNRRNLALLEAALSTPQAAKKNSLLFLISLGIIMIAGLIGVIALIAWLLSLIISAIAAH